MADKKVIMIAHKGYSGKYPENTALAFRMAGEHGSGGAETDVRYTTDGVFVTHHDDEVRYADGTVMRISSVWSSKTLTEPKTAMSGSAGHAAIFSSREASQRSETQSSPST